MEVEILNGGMKNLKRPMPVIFIPASSKEFVKEMEEEVMTAFLQPFIKELEYAIIHGFVVSYNFPSELIFEGLPSLYGTSDSKLWAMPMYWTGDHLA